MSNIFNETAITQNDLFAEDKYLLRKQKAADPDLRIKQAIWAYFLLLIFEGALRKWILPGLATPLLVIRDPLALWLLFKVYQSRRLPEHSYITGSVIIGILGIFTAVLLGHGSLPVALFGARILVFHFPLMFVIGKIFNRDDVIKIGKVTLWLTIGMAVLTGLQFYSPQLAWVNRGIGGDMAGSGFSGSMGYFRPTGTFSFTNGNSLFFSFAAIFIFYFWFNPKGINKIILMGATIGLLSAIPFSISRALFFSVIVTLIFAIIGVVRKPKYIGKTIGAVIGFIIVLFILSNVSFFNTALEAFTARFDSANKIEGGTEGVLIDRYLGGLVGAIDGGINGNMPFWGYGIGMGTNVGSMLLTGSKSYLIAEGEWGRLIGELGLLMGLAIIFFRLGFSASVGVSAYKNLVKGDLLPWFLLSFGLLIIPQGQWAQPTSLGFSTLIGGLLLSSLRTIKPVIPDVNSLKVEG